jgi:hypothetical protein
MYLNRNSLLVCYLVAVLSACGGSSEDKSVEPPSQVNIVPVAKIKDINSDSPLGVEVTLDGSGSEDANGDILTYLWTIKSKPAESSLILSGKTSSSTSFLPDVIGEYTFEFIVNDGKADSQPTEVTFRIFQPNRVPFAEFNVEDITLGENLVLDATSSHDIDGDSLTYEWVLQEKPEASSLELNDSTSMILTLLPDVYGSYKFSLIVNDGELSSSEVSADVTVNAMPVALVSDDSSFPLGNEVQVHGSFIDEDNTEVTYHWELFTVPTDSNLTELISTKPYFAFSPDIEGEFIAQLIVNDGKVDSLPEQVVITVTAREEHVTQVQLTGNSITKVGLPVPVDFSETISKTGEKLSFTTKMLSGIGRPSLTTSLIEPAQVEFKGSNSGWHKLGVTVTENGLTSEEIDAWVLVQPSSEDVIPKLTLKKSHFVMSNVSVEIDASNKVIDLDGGELYYKWEVLAKPAFTDPVVLDDTNNAIQIFSFEIPGIYSFKIEVSNHGDFSQSYSKTVDLYVYENETPIISDAGVNIDTLSGTELLLDGSRSLRYEDVDSLKWTITSAPYNSVATILDATSINAQFTPDVMGRYIAQLSLIIDDKLYSGDTMVIDVENPIPEYDVITKGADTDGDGIKDIADLFPNDPDEWYDFDLDGIGDNADLDYSPNGVAIKDIYFPDDTFRECISTLTTNMVNSDELLELSCKGLYSEVQSGDYIRIKDLSGIEHLSNLTTLFLDWNQPSSLLPLASLSNLTKLGLFRNDLSDLTHLANLTNLESLYLMGNNITDITPLGQLGKLTYLGLAENNVADITTIGSITSLLSLDLRQNRNASGFEVILNLINMTSLTISNTSPSSFDFLSSLVMLETLSVTNVETLKDLTPVMSIDSLKRIFMYGVTLDDPSQIDTLQAKGVEIYGD